MDADDIATPSRLRLQLEFLETNGYDLVSACATTLGKFPARTFGIPMNDREVAFSLLFFNSIVHPLVMGRAWVFKNHPYSAEFEWAEDYHLWTRLSLSGIKIGVDHSRLLRYRLHSSQVSFAKQEKQRDLTRRVGENYMRELTAGHGNAQPKDGDLLARFEFGLRMLSGASSIGPETRGRALRAILPSSLASWGDLGALRATYHRHGAFMGLADYVIALASLLSQKSGSDVPKRMAARLVS
jgi:hypothetical protein